MDSIFPQSAERPRLPRILCLHGGGASATIFKIQTIRLAHYLRPHFHLVFLDAPFPSPAGPGVLPVFESVGPYYRWTPVKEGDDVSKVRTVIRKAMIEEGDGMPFVGILGFSQGAMLASGILREQFQRGAGLGGEDQKFKFGVCLVGGFPPLSLDTRFTATGDPYVFGTGKDDERLQDSIGVSSIHMHGLRDPVLPNSQALARCYKDKLPDGAQPDVEDQRIQKTVLEFDVEHHMPAGMPDSKTLAFAILRTYYGPDWKPDDD